MEIIEEKYIRLTIKKLLSLQLKKSQAYQGNKQIMVGTVELTKLPIMHLFILLYFNRESHWRQNISHVFDRLECREATYEL